jgi:TRAP-type C4-dicarboxylate transport system permease large subunit
MVLIGFVLIAAAGVVGIDVAAQNHFAIDVDAFGQMFSTSASAVFVAGVVTGLAACVGLMLFRDGFIRTRRARAEARQTRLERERMAAAYEREHGLERAGETRDLDLRERDLDREHVTTF